VERGFSVKMGKHMQILGPVDTAFYMVDTLETPMNIGAMTVFEGKIAFDEFFKLIAEDYQGPAEPGTADVGVRPGFSRRQSHL
jgi:hypothetical protein